MSEQREQYAVIVTRPDSPDRPDAADLVVRIGPYGSQYRAERVVDWLNATAHQRSRPEGTTVTVAPYDEALPHRPTLEGAGVDAVMEAIRAEPDVWAEWSFPDTWDILSTVYEYGRASDLHQRACAFIDAEAEALEAQEREEREQLAAAEVAAYAYAECRDAAVVAARRHVTPVTRQTITATANLLDDLATLAEAHKVDRAALLAAFAPAALEVTAASRPPARFA